MFTTGQMMKPKIQSGIAIPAPTGRGRHTGFSAAVNQLEVGDSLKLGAIEPKNARVAAYRARPKEFTVRPDEGGVYRIWRLA